MTDPALVLQQLPLQFSYNHRPTIPITFRSGKKSVNCTGLVDSGASYTLFHASLANTLGIDLTNAPTLPFIGVGHGTITGYEAPVEIGIGGVFYPASVYFSHDLNPNVEGMLGQVGFFDNFVVEFDRSGKSLLVKDRNALVTAQLLQATNASILGKEIALDQFVTIEQEERLKGFYVIGNTGSGKTTLLVNLILQDIEQGMGVCFFDTHGDAITDILKRLPVHREKDVILLDLLDTDYPFGLNLYQCDNPKDGKQASYTVNNVLDIFAKLFADGDLSKMPRMAQVLRNTAYTLVANPGTSMAEVPLLLTDENALEKLKKNVANPQVKLFLERYGRMKPQEQHEWIDSTLNKMDEFLTDELSFNIFAQSRTTIDFRKIMDERKILLVKLSREYPELTSLVGSTIISHLATAAYSREDTPEDQRIQFNLFADEYQRFSTPVFAELLAEVRKYKIATCVAHQWRGQLDHANRGATLNAANMVVYQVSGEDAKELAGQFDTTPPPPQPEEKTRRAIQTPVKDVVHHLLNRGGHPDPVVNQFAHEVLTKMQTVKDYHNRPLDALNRFLYKAMTGTQTKLEDIHAFIADLCWVCEIYAFNAHLYDSLISLSSPVPIQSTHLHTYIPEVINAFHTYWETGNSNPLYQVMYQRIRTDIFDDLRAELLHWETTLDSWHTQVKAEKWQAKIAINPYSYNPEDDEWVPIAEILTEYGNICNPVAQSLSSGGHGYTWTRNLTTIPPWFSIDLWQVEWEQHTEKRPATVIQGTYLPPHDRNTWKLRPNQEWKCYRQVDFDAAVNQIYREQSRKFDEVLTQLKQTVQALAKEPIEDDSGRQEIVMGHGMQLSSAEMEARISNQLTNPAIPYTARAKLGTQEYTIQALPFRQPDAPDVVKARLERIITQTRKNYCKKRDEVQKEIAARQNELTKPEPPPSRKKRGEEEI